jgi:hypothetical protein
MMSTCELGNCRGPPLVSDHTYALTEGFQMQRGNEAETLGLVSVLGQ